MLTFDLVMAALSVSARQALEQLMANHYEFQYPPLRESFNRGKAEGQAEGRAQGQAEGLALGKAKTLVRLLERRFGGVGPAHRVRVEGATVEQLDRWLDRLLTEGSVDAVLADLPR